jgi:CRP/FNR family transcriptional regulator, nitrogen fixation regulation protein
MNPTPSLKSNFASASHAERGTHHPLQGLDSIAMVRSWRRGQEICRQGQAAKTWYCVLAGAAMGFVIKSDGRRQIVDLMFPGDFFGFTSGPEYENTVEAVAPGTMVAAYARASVEAMADSDPQLTREIRQITFDQLSRLQVQLLIIGRIRVPQKVASFIVAMADRLSQGHSDRVTLPVTRYDIADFLAVSVETVSRALTDLTHRGLIRFSGTRDIQIVDRDSLDDIRHDDVFAGPHTPAARTPIPRSNGSEGHLHHGGRQSPPALST